MKAPCLPVLALFLAVVLPFPIAAAEYTNGAIRLVLHPETGRFSLYSLRHQTIRREPLALFFAHDPRTSFLSVTVDGNDFTMGDSPLFRTSVSGSSCNPSLVFESPALLVTKAFSFARSADSPETNGISVRITLENRGNRQVWAGAGFLLNTRLGDGSFSTSRRAVVSDTLLTRNDRDSFWIDRGSAAFLSGSLFTGSGEDPDSVRFGDSTVFYYFGRRPLGRGERRSFGFFLFVNSEAVLAAPEITGGEAILDMPVVTAPVAHPTERYLAEIRGLMAQLDSLIASGTATEAELAALELAMNNLRARYGAW